MKAFMNKAKKIHRNQKGFTLIELLVVMAILALLVGLVLPNFFDVANEGAATQIQGQHQNMRTAVFLYHMDTGQWPTEWSGHDLGVPGMHQLWENYPAVAGWDGPYLERPILRENRWGGYWGIHEDRRLDLDHLNNGQVGDPLFTALLYSNVPLEVARDLDEAMDDGDPTTGVVQYGGTNWPSGRTRGGADPYGHPDDANFLEIIIASQE